MDPIQLGVYVRFPHSDHTLDIIAEPPQVAAYTTTPWSRAFFSQRLGIPAQTPARPDALIAQVSDSQLARHSLLVGGSGYGKSRLIHRNVLCHLLDGCSVLLLDPKGETKDNLLACLVELGIPPERLTLLNPQHADSVPGWNPFKTGLPVSQAANDFVNVLQQTSTSWGPRLQDLISNSGIIVGEYGLSIFELARFLVREEYRESLLQVPIQPQNPIAFAEAVSFFREEMSAWGRAERANAIGPVLTRIREFLRSAYLRPLLCAEENTFDLAELWRKQCIVVVHVDRAELGEAGAHLLAGTLANQAFRTALRMPGRNRVLLVVDELGQMEAMMGRALTDIVTVARSLNLRLLVACQHLAQLSQELREALLANCTVQGFFKLGYDDAKLVAASLSAGAPATIQRFVASFDPETQTTWSHRICGGEGLPLRLPEPRWAHFAQGGLTGRSAVQRLLALGKTSKQPRLYVRAADTQQPVELTTYVSGLPDSDYSLAGPALELVVTFPRPRIANVERVTASDVASTWIRELQNLPVQHIALRLAGTEPGIVKVSDVTIPERTPALDAYLARSYAANGQSAAEIARVLAARTAAVERLAAGIATGTSPIQEDHHDGSIW